MTTYIAKRDGTLDPFSFEKFTKWIEELLDGLDRQVIDPTTFTLKVRIKDFSFENLNGERAK